MGLSWGDSFFKTLLQLNEEKMLLSRYSCVQGEYQDSNWYSQTLMKWKEKHILYCKKIGKMLNQGSVGMDMGGNSLKYQVGKVILHTVWI